MMQGEASRSSAKKICGHIMNLLQEFGSVIINLQNANLTPSVADEIIGVLAEKLGAGFFKQKIKIKNASETQVVLMRHVIARRVT